MCPRLSVHGSSSFNKKHMYVHVCYVASVVPDSATLWTVVHQTSQFMEFSRQEC